jgi:hypothetical protein
VSKQTHIFATRSDLEPGLQRFEAAREIKYARCDLYYGPVYEQYLSLLAWPGLGKNPTGDHMSGPCFLVVPRDFKINVEAVPQVQQSGAKLFSQKVWTVAGSGELSNAPSSLEQCLSDLEGRPSNHRTPNVRYDVSQKLNADSIVFSPGGIYNGERVLICGHIGTISASAIAQDLYKTFVKATTKDFEKIGSYRVGPEAARLMDAGYRMVTIGMGSPRAYDLHRSA